MMKTAMFAAASLLVAGLGATALAATDAETCKFVQDTAKGFNGKDRTAVVNCPTKVADFALSIPTESAKMKAGWQDRVIGDWEKSVCAAKTLSDAVKSGWIISVTWTTSDKVQYRAETKCP